MLSFRGTQVTAPSRTHSVGFPRRHSCTSAKMQCLFLNLFFFSHPSFLAVKNKTGAKRQLATPHCAGLLHLLPFLLLCLSVALKVSNTNIGDDSSFKHMSILPQGS